MAKFVRANSIDGQGTIQFKQAIAPSNLNGVLVSDIWLDTSGVPVLRLCSSTDPVTFIPVGGGGTIAAPSAAKFWVRELDGTLTNEQVLTPGNYAEASITVVTGTSQQLSVNKTYIINSNSLCTCTLPASLVFGDFCFLRNVGTGGFRIAQNASQVIHFGSMNTTTGGSGYLQTTSQYDSIDLLCTTSTTDLMVSGCIGNITVV